MKNILPIALYDRMQAGDVINLIDVRTPSEYSEIHIVGARLYPITQFNPEAFLQELRETGHAGKTVFAVCRGGPRSQKVCEMLQSAGHTDVVNVEGGTDAWVRAGLPVVRGKAAISLERQTQLTIGIMILIGMFLGLSLSAWFYLIPFVIGVGLMHAGLSGYCMFTQWLSTMPWNR